MMILRMRHGSVPGPQAHPEFIKFVDNLQTTMQPLIRPTRELLAARLGIAIDSLQWGIGLTREPVYLRGKRSSFSEVFILETGLLVVTMRSTSRGRLQRTSDGSIMEVYDDSDFSLDGSAITSTVEAANTALDALSSAAKSVFDVDMTDNFYSSDRYESIRREAVAEELPSTDDTVRAAKALSIRPARTLAISIKSSRGLLAKDIEKQADARAASALVEKLISDGVAARDVVVVCGITQTQVARVPDRGSLAKLSEDGLRCACGRPIDQESAEDLLTITDLGALLLDKSRWLSVVVREELVALGVPRGDILLECQFGSDEVDCIAQISGATTIFELKDKEFNMGNAYSFSAKISAINPDYSIIISTDKVATDVKERFSRVRRDSRDVRRGVSTDENSIQYVEGDNFQAALQEAISMIYRSDARRILENALENVAPDAASVLKAITCLQNTMESSAPSKRKRKVEHHRPEALADAPRETDVAGN